MTVYHGTTLIVKSPSAKYSKKYLDFGIGFYVTADKIQSERWAKRKAIRLNTKPTVNVYTLSDNLAGYNGLVFEDEDVNWLNFVANCRRGSNDYTKYDYVSGSVANDDVFLTVDMYMRGIWKEDRALEEIRYYKTSHQICLVSQALMDCELNFEESYEVK
ncbi:MAG: DUF3990 domain-containing protein [Oscillospiraceae bacterium]|nr:DUF3990 domain-containing protein [Oscillospiraceae bacterium]MCL2279770.1 DUF3990 domain-containing protein [Oscillospiraceae bacterium]